LKMFSPAEDDINDSEEKKFRCDGCGKGFRNERDLKQHVNNSKCSVETK